ncbi:thiamine diphosphokinase [Oscillospiraceae bacterium WX1]
MTGICYIVGAGAVPELTLEAGERDFVIAADAGYRHLSVLSAVADLVVGDFDSLGFRPNHPNVIQHPPEKDETDMMLAITEGLRRSYKKFVLLGGLGGRLDHTMANIQALNYLAAKNARGYLLGDGTAATVIRNGSLSFDSGREGSVSVFSIGESAMGVTLRGLKYELKNATLKDTFPLGASNAFTGAPGEVSVISGSLLVIWEENAADVIDSLKESCYSAT